MESVLWSVFWVLAGLFSMFWGVYGVVVELEDNEKKFKGFPLGLFIMHSGTFISEVSGSLAGWGALYFLIWRIRHDPGMAGLGVFDVFLGTVAVVAMTGFAHKLCDTLSGKQQKDSKDDSV